MSVVPDYLSELKSVLGSNLKPSQLKQRISDNKKEKKEKKEKNNVLNFDNMTDLNLLFNHKIINYVKIIPNTRTIQALPTYE